MNVHFEFPLQWLPQQPRTKNPRKPVSFRDDAYYNGLQLVNELRKLGAKNCIISSNLITRVDNTSFLKNQTLTDNGVVVYFDLKGQPKAMACDKWNKASYNLRALTLSVSAIRGLERWGGSEFLDGLFTGFKALPETTIMNGVSYFSEFSNKDEAKVRYHELCKEHHPDLGGDLVTFQEVQRQYNQLKEVKL